MKDADDPEKWTTALADLIATYEKSPQSKLDSEVKNFPGTKYSDILEKLKELRIEAVKEGGAPKPGLVEQVRVYFFFFQ